MIKRIALGLAVLAAFSLPAAGETASKACVTAIKTANARHRAALVPPDCWRIGPLKLGMTLAQARTLLGTPGASQSVTMTYRRRKIPMTRLFYVYPRNLRNWLKLAPARVEDFHPVTLKLDFSDGKLVAVAAEQSAHTQAPPCKPSAPGHAFVHRNADFPYGFHGLTLGAPMPGVMARFGKFAAAASGFNIYAPVPLSVSGTDKVSGFRFATGAPFESGGGTPVFQLERDPRSCFVTGYVLTPGA